VAAVVSSLGVTVVSETYTDFLCLCPFHANTHTPAFTVGKNNGLWMCHNASCSGNAGGNLVKLVLTLSGRNDMEALRFISKKGHESKQPLEVKIAAIEAEDRWPTVPQMKIDELADLLRKTPRALKYVTDDRGFTEDTIRFFEVGYDPEKDMVVVPIHDSQGNPIGVNGRSVEGKRFKLTKRIPRNKILFNLHRAKHYGTAIICESQFDVMRIHQAGFPNAVCALGSHVSKEQAWLLQRYFERVVIMTDADDAGRMSGHKIDGMLRHAVRVEWAVYSEDAVYPPGCKDAGDMTEEQIKKMITNAIPSIMYNETMV
jgi:DNA primase